MNASAPAPAGIGSRLRPFRAGGLLLVGLLVSLVPLSRRAPKTQVILLVVPERFRDSRGQVDVSWTRDGDTEPLGGFTLAFPDGLPASLRREISVPDGKYRLDVALAKAGGAGGIGKTVHDESRIEIARQLSLDGTEVRVLLEDTSP
jgi:hypothetical protein